MRNTDLSGIALMELLIILPVCIVQLDSCDELRHDSSELAGDRDCFAAQWT